MTLDFRRLKVHQGAQGAQGTRETDDEYDFMGSEDALPAQLDLARTYIAMKDFKQARQVLLTIIKKGSMDQKKQAQMMLDGLSSGKMSS